MMMNDNTNRERAIPTHLLHILYKTKLPTPYNNTHLTHSHYHHYKPEQKT